jgi:hypothetical protein
MSEQQPLQPMPEPTQPAETPAVLSEQPRGEHYSVTRVRGGLALTLVGFLVFILGVRPSLFGLDRSPVIGFVQVATFLLGLAIICVGGYISLLGLWGGRQLSIVADIGSRLVATGYVICVFSGLADILGLGSQLPPFAVPSFGDWQVLGVEIGQMVIAIGMVMMIPFHRFGKEPQSPPDETST